MLFIFLLVIPLLGVIWFLNFMTFLSNLKNGVSTHNQKILGAVWTFIFIFTIMYCYASTHY